MSVSVDDVDPADTRPRGPIEQLADRYLEIMRYRTEALEKYHANVLSFFSGPPSRIRLPIVRRSDVGDTIKRIGPFHFADRPPIAPYVEAVIERADRPLRILEIGPGTGALAKALRQRFGTRIAEYYAVDRDRTIRGEFVPVASIDDVPDGIDVVIAAEVIEHMPVDDFYDRIVRPLRAKLSPNAALLISTPNPLSPGGIARDFTHVQRYPWYDLYAVFRLAFDDVSITRVHYVFSFRRLLQIVPRIVLCLLLELEWCDTLVCVGVTPSARAVSERPS